MRPIVYFSFPAHGHINPTLPVVRELVRRGQQVAYFSTECFRNSIEETGPIFRPYTSQFQMPEQGPGPFAQVSSMLETLLDLSCTVLDHHLEQVRGLRPSVILHDSFAPWGRLVAQILHLPAIASVPSILINAEIDARYKPKPGIRPEDPRLTPQWYAAFRSRCQACVARYGLTEALLPPQLLQRYGDLNVVYTSRFFQPLEGAFDEDRFKFVGPCFDFRPHAPPFPFERLDGRPLVLISLGTVYGNRPEFFQMCLEELADSPWQIVLAAGTSPPLEFPGSEPENFIVRSFVPQIELLRRCAAFVTHGGMNSVQEALYHGVPLIMAPQGADQFWISARTSELGAGIVLDPPMEAGALRRAIETILSSTTYSDAAEQVGASLRSAGGPVAAANEIHDFIRRRCG
jgi:MGT family glycosyltransferase